MPNSQFLIDINDFVKALYKCKERQLEMGVCILSLPSPLCSITIFIFLNKLIIPQKARGFYKFGTTKRNIILPGIYISHD